MLETKITIVGVKQIVPNENRFLTPEMYTVYVKNILTTFVPLQFAIDLTFLSLGVRKRIGARGKFEYDAEYEEKVYFWRGGGINFKTSKKKKNFFSILFRKIVVFQYL